eukprot:scaffold5820_cov82-Skeletonema_dohrnii-CCMP3373.AAC.1
MYILVTHRGDSLGITIPLRQSFCLAPASQLSSSSSAPSLALCCGCACNKLHVQYVMEVSKTQEERSTIRSTATAKRMARTKALVPRRIYGRALQTYNRDAIEYIEYILAHIQKG